jgi:parvulin-like peptidyl-prolyl isomerase
MRPPPVLQVGTRTLTAEEVLPLAVRCGLLPVLCREILLDQAIAPIVCEPADLLRARQQFAKELETMDPVVRQQWCAGLSPQQMDDLATRPCRIEAFKQQRWGHQLEAQFLQQKAQFDQVIYSLLRTTQAETAQELYFRIKAGEQSFADLARQFSEGPEAETGGLLGPVPLTQPHLTIAQRLHRSQPGQLLPPFRLENWTVILRLEKRVPAQLDAPTRRRLLDHLFETWIRDQLAQPDQVALMMPPQADTEPPDCVS